MRLIWTLPMVPLPSHPLEKPNFKTDLSIWPKKFGLFSCGIFFQTQNVTRVFEIDAREKKESMRLICAHLMVPLPCRRPQKPDFRIDLGPLA